MAGQFEQEPGVSIGEEKIRILARLVYYQEAERIKSVPFKSEFHRSQYLSDCLDTYKAAISLLDDKPQTTKAPSLTDSDSNSNSIANDIYGYSQDGVSVALQCFSSLYVRRKYLDKLTDHRQSLMTRLTEINNLPAEEQAAAAKALVEELVTTKNAALQYWRSRVSVNQCLVSVFRKGPGGYTFDGLVAKYQRLLVETKGPEYDGVFDDLEDTKKIEIYEEVIKDYGVGGPIINKLEKVANYAGISLLLFTAGMMVWDVSTAEHKGATAARDIVDLAANLAGGYVGEVVGTYAASAAVSTTTSLAESFLGYVVPTETFTTAIASTETAAAVALPIEAVSFFATASTAFICVASVVTGVVGGLIFGAFAGWLVERFIHSGGKHNEKDVKAIKTHVSADNLHYFVAPMPDGTRLARQLTVASQA